MLSLSLGSLLLAALPFGTAKPLNLLDKTTSAHLATSPLHVQLEHSEIPGNVRAIITNQGLTTAYFSTWGNPLSKDERARKVEVFTTKEEPVQFLNAEGWVDSEITPSDYEKVLAGNSIVREVALSSNYELQPEEEYLVQAGGFVSYHVEGDKSEGTQSAAYETNVLSFTATKSQPLRFGHGIEAPSASNFIFTACGDEVLSNKLNKSLPIAAALAKKAAENTANGKSKEAFVAYFKNDTPENRKKVSDRFKAMAQSLTDTKGPVKISCRAKCEGYYAIGAAWTEPTTGKTEFCPALKAAQYPDEVKRCNRGNFPGVIIHELSHSSILFRPSTNDRAQTAQQCKALPEAQALVNADNFNLYAQSVFLDTVC